MSSNIIINHVVAAILAIFCNIDLTHHLYRHAKPTIVILDHIKYPHLLNVVYVMIGVILVINHLILIAHHAILMHISLILVHVIIIRQPQPLSMLFKVTPTLQLPLTLKIPAQYHTMAYFSQKNVSHAQQAANIVIFT